MVQVTKKLLRNVQKVSYAYGPLDSDPFLMLQHFFEANTLEEFSEQLEKWYHCADPSSKLNSAYGIHFLMMHKMACQLVNMAWLLKESLHVKSVDKSPFLASIVNLFENMPLASFHQVLYHWLQDSLDNRQVYVKIAYENVYQNVLEMAKSCNAINAYMHSNRCSDLPEDTPKVPVKNPSKDGAELGLAAQDLFETVSPIKLNRSLRKMLVDYLLFNTSGLPSDLSEVLDDYYWLCDFLDRATLSLQKLD